MWICDCCSELNSDESKKCSYCGLKKTMRGTARSPEHKTKRYVYAAMITVAAAAMCVGVLIAKDRFFIADDSEPYETDVISKNEETVERADNAHSAADIGGFSAEHQDNPGEDANSMPSAAARMPTDNIETEYDGLTDYSDAGSTDYIGCWGSDRISEFVIYEQEGQTISFIVVSYNSTGTKVAASVVRNVELHNGSGSFKFADSWGNTGHGTISFSGDKMELNIVSDYTNNSNWAVDQASGRYTKFTDVIDQGVLDSFYEEGVANNPPDSEYGYISQTIFPLPDGEQIVQVVNVRSETTGIYVEAFELHPVVFMEESLQNYSTGSVIEVGDEQWEVEYIDTVDGSWYLSGGMFVKESDGLWHAVYTSDAPAYSRSPAVYSVKEPSDGSAQIIDNTNLQNIQLSSAYDLFRKYGEFRAKVKVRNFDLIYMEKYYSP